MSKEDLGRRGRSKKQNRFRERESEGKKPYIGKAGRGREVPGRLSH